VDKPFDDMSKYFDTIHERCFETVKCHKCPITHRSNPFIIEKKTEIKAQQADSRAQQTVINCNNMDERDKTVMTKFRYCNLVYNFFCSKPGHRSGCREGCSNEIWALLTNNEDLLVSVVGWMVFHLPSVDRHSSKPLADRPDGNDTTAWTGEQAATVGTASQHHIHSTLSHTLHSAGFVHHFIQFAVNHTAPFGSFINN